MSVSVSVAVEAEVVAAVTVRAIDGGVAAITAAPSPVPRGGAAAPDSATCATATGALADVPTDTDIAPRL
jgi:hypothetical protein